MRKLMIALAASVLNTSAAAHSGTSHAGHQHNAAPELALLDLSS